MKVGDKVVCVKNTMHTPAQIEHGIQYPKPDGKTEYTVRSTYVEFGEQGLRLEEIINGCVTSGSEHGYLSSDFRKVDRIKELNQSELATEGIERIERIEKEREANPITAPDVEPVLN